MRWAGHAERSGEKRSASSLVGKHEERRPFEDVLVDGKIILKCIIREWYLCNRSRFGRPAVLYLGPIIGVFQLKIHRAKVQSCFVRVR